MIGPLFILFPCNIITKATTHQKGLCLSVKRCQTASMKNTAKPRLERRKESDYCICGLYINEVILFYRITDVSNSYRLNISVIQ
jgi:hypothetical protein